MEKIWADRAWEEYLSYQEEDKKLLRKLNKLIRDIERDPYKGIGKPEPLTGDWAGFYSRHITDKHRIIYRINDGKLEIASCKGHYNDK